MSSGPASPRQSLGDALEEIVVRWPAGGLPDPGAEVRSLLSPQATAVLDKVAEVIGHTLPADLRAAVSGGTDTQGQAVLAALAGVLWMSRRDAMLRARDAVNRHDIDNLEAAAQAALSISSKLWEDADMALGFLLLGQAARGRNDLSAAVACYRAALDLAVRLGLPDQACAALDNLGNALRDQGQIDEALTCYQRAAEMVDSPAALARIENNRSLALIEAGRPREAAAAIQLAADLLGQTEEPPLARATLLDSLAQAAMGIGDLTTADSLLEQARPLFAATGSAYDIFINAWSRAQMSLRLGRMDTARDTFVEAHDTISALRSSDLHPEHYTVDFRRRLAATPVDPEAAESARPLLQEGLDARNDGRWPMARERLLAAAAILEKAGASYDALMAMVNVAITAVDVGDVERALPLLLDVRARAHQMGAARPEMQALFNLFRLASTVPDVLAYVHPFDLLVQARALSDLLPAVADALGVAGPERTALLLGRGGAEDALARQCQPFGADELALGYARRAVELAPPADLAPLAFSRANRLANLLILLHPGEAVVVARELEALQRRWPDDLLLAMTAHRALGQHAAATDPAVAIRHLEASCAAYETLRRRIEPGPGRAGLRISYPPPYGDLFDLRVATGDTAGAWEAAQSVKDSRLLDALDRAGRDLGASSVGTALPATVDALARLSPPGSEPPVGIDLVLCRDCIVAFALDEHRPRPSVEARTVPVPGGLGAWVDRLQLDLAMGGPGAAAQWCQSDPVLQQLAATMASLAERGRPVVLTPDGPLHNLPLHALVIDGGAWCDRNPISLLPASGLLTRSPGQPAPARGRVLVAGDSRQDLPGARRECAYVSQLWGTTPVLGADCTLERLHRELGDGTVDVLHLAVHGTALAARGRAAGLILADGAGGTTLVAFEELCALGLRADLVVLSGCSTAVAGPLHGHQLIGVALAALEAGARSVVACLWPVDDGAAETFMRRFHETLVAARPGSADLRACMAAGRAAVRDDAPFPQAQISQAQISQAQIPEAQIPEAQISEAQSSPVAATRRRDGREVAPEEMEPALADDIRSELDWAPFVLLGDVVLEV